MQFKLHYCLQSQREIFATSERYDYGIRRQAVTQPHIPSGALLMAKHGKLAPLNNSAIAMERFSEHTTDPQELRYLDRRQTLSY